MRTVHEQLHTGVTRKCLRTFNSNTVHTCESLLHYNLRSQQNAEVCKRPKTHFLTNALTFTLVTNITVNFLVTKFTILPRVAMLTFAAMFAFITTVMRAV